MKFLASLLAAAALLFSAPGHAAGVPIAGVDHVGINVPDLKAAQAFFIETFGCVPVTRIGPFPLDPAASATDSAFAPRADSVTLAMIRCGTGANIELFEYTNPRGSKEMPQLAEAGASHIAFYTEDIAAGVAYLKSHGVTVLGEPITMSGGDTGGETWVHFRAPWGAEMELVSYPRGKAYEARTAQRLWNPARPAQ
nr:VOC family protein [Herbaspirillum sp. ASV7]